MLKRGNTTREKTRTQEHSPVFLYPFSLHCVFPAKHVCWPGSISLPVNVWRSASWYDSRVSTVLHLFCFTLTVHIRTELTRKPKQYMKCKNKAITACTRLHQKTFCVASNVLPIVTCSYWCLMVSCSIVTGTCASSRMKLASRVLCVILAERSETVCKSGNTVMQPSIGATHRWVLVNHIKVDK